MQPEQRLVLAPWRQTHQTLHPLETQARPTTAHLQSTKLQPLERERPPLLQNRPPEPDPHQPRALARLLLARPSPWHHHLWWQSQPTQHAKPQPQLWLQMPSPEATRDPGHSGGLAAAATIPAIPAMDNRRHRQLLQRTP